jgi:hypothetical protein
LPSLCSTRWHGPLEENHCTLFHAFNMPFRHSHFRTLPLPRLKCVNLRLYSMKRPLKSVHFFPYLGLQILIISDIPDMPWFPGWCPFLIPGTLYINLNLASWYLAKSHRFGVIVADRTAKPEFPKAYSWVISWVSPLTSNTYSSASFAVLI